MNFKKKLLFVIFFNLTYISISALYEQGSDLIENYYDKGTLPPKVCFELGDLPLPQINSNVPQFDTIMAFGDSYSDNGNIFKSTFGLSPSRKYYCKGRYSNGPVWVEYLTKNLNRYYKENVEKDKYEEEDDEKGIELVNFAYGGATSSNKLTKISGFIPSMHDQVTLKAKSFLKKQYSKYPAVKGNKKNINNTLATFWLAGNDYTNPKISASQVIPQLEIIFTHLIVNYSLKHLMIVFASPFDSAPRSYLGWDSERKTRDALNWKQHNVLLEKLVDKLNQKYEVNITRFYTEEIWTRLLKNAPEEQLSKGWNGTYPCLDSVSLPSTTKGSLGKESWSCKNPEKRFFWDDVHPTTTVHRSIGMEGLRALLKNYGF